MDSIKIDTGEIRLAITDKFDNVKGEIVFNPTDLILVEKLERLVANIEGDEPKEFIKRGEEIFSKADVDSSGVPINWEERKAFLKDFHVYMCKKIDDVLGNGVSHIAFADYVPNPAIEGMPDIYGQLVSGVLSYVHPVRQKKIEQYIPSARNGKSRKSHK